jgi:carboxylesterase
MTTSIMPGCESFSSTGSSHGVLILHGFTGNPQSMRPLAEAVANAGFTVELPRLPGHGTTVEDMMTTTWADWSSAAEAAYESLAGRCEKVAIVGLSMGGALTAYVGQRHDVDALVFINPIVKPAPDEDRAAIQLFIDAGVLVNVAIGSDIKKEGPKEASYDATPLACALSLMNGLDDVYAHLTSLNAPTLLFTSREDHVVTDPINGDLLMSSVAAPIERVWLENSYHVATLDNDAAFLEATTIAFLTRTLDA